MQGYIYLLQSDYGYKIGKSKSPKTRNNIFSVKLPFEVEMIKTIKVDNYHQVEKDLHKHFEDKHLNGEWFDLTKEEVEEFEELVAKYNIVYTITLKKFPKMNFYQHNFKLISWMIDENPTALKLLLWIVEQIDRKNAIVVSLPTLAEALNSTTRTIQRAIKFLRENECIAVNADIVWTNTHEKKKSASIHIENKFAIEAQYKMTLIEQKIFYALVSRLNPRTEKEFKEVSLTVQDIAKALGGDLKTHQNLYSRVQDITDRMIQKSFKFATPVKINGEFLTGPASFFQSVIPRYNEQGEATIYFRFNDLLKPFLLQLNEYVKMNQLCIAQINSVYAIRFYTVLKAIRAKRQKHGKISREKWRVGELKSLLVATEQYPRFYDFKKRAIEPAFKEINKKTDIVIIEINYIKAGRTTKEIEFVFTDQVDSKKQASKSKVLSQPIKAPKPQTTQKKKVQSNTHKKYKKQIETLTLAQYFALNFLEDETRDVNIKIILEEILPRIAKMGEVPRGFEDIYIESVWRYVQNKSKVENPESWAAIFISWWRNPESLTHDKNVAIFFDAVHDFKRSIRDTQQDINRRKAQRLPVREAQLKLKMIKNKAAELVKKTQPSIEKPSPKRTKGDVKNIREMVNEIFSRE